MISPDFCQIVFFCLVPIDIISICTKSGVNWSHSGVSHFFTILKCKGSVSRRFSPFKLYFSVNMLLFLPQEQLPSVTIAAQRLSGLPHSKKVPGSIPGLCGSVCVSLRVSPRVWMDFLWFQPKTCTLGVLSRRVTLTIYRPQTQTH